MRLLTGHTPPPDPAHRGIVGATEAERPEAVHRAGDRVPLPSPVNFASPAGLSYTSSGKGDMVRGRASLCCRPRSPPDLNPLSSEMHLASCWQRFSPGTQWSITSSHSSPVGGRARRPQGRGLQDLHLLSRRVLSPGPALVSPVTTGRFQISPGSHSTTIRLFHPNLGLRLFIHFFLPHCLLSTSSRAGTVPGAGAQPCGVLSSPMA